MAVLEMQKINIILYKSHLQNVIDYLQNKELIEVVSLKKEEAINLGPSFECVTDYEYNISEIKHFFDIIKKYDPEKPGFIESFMGEKEEIKEAELYQNFKQFDYKKLIKEAEILENTLQHSENNKNKLLDEQKVFNKWKSFKYPLSSLNPSSNFIFIIGKILKKQINNFKNELLSLNEHTAYEIVEEDKRYVKLIIAIDSSKQTDLIKSLEKWNFNVCNLPDNTNITVSQKLNKISSELKETNDKINETRTKLNNFIKYKRNMYLIYDYLIIDRDKSCIRENFWASNSIYVIEGWMIKNRFNELKQQLKEFGTEIELLQIEPEENETVPVIIKNPAFITPFETVTNIFGNPSYGEIDPTLPLSFFFILYFGLCLSDAGYGMVLIFIAVYLKMKYKAATKGIKKLLQLLLFGGIATIPVGILTGGWFGIAIDELPQSIIKTALISMRIIDPLKNPIIMLGFSIALGISQVLTGVLIKMYWNIKIKNYKEAFMDNFLWFFFLSSILFLISTKTVLPDLDYLSTKLAILGAVLLIITQGRSKKNIFGKFFSGLVSLYNTSAYMGDVLSYSRLLALGLTSTVIGMIINIIAMLSKEIPFVGWIVMIIILVIGHLFNIIISTLGAFIHSARLQLVEFFGKFFEGGGKAFKPFKRETKYTLIK